jgi:hypothetical protein
LEKTATDSGIYLQISTPSLAKEADVTYENFQLSSSGDFSKILKFLQELEAGPYLVNIQNLYIGSDKSSLRLNKIEKANANLSIKVLAK